MILNNKTKFNNSNNPRRTLNLKYGKLSRQVDVNGLTITGYKYSIAEQKLIDECGYQISRDGGLYGPTAEIHRTSVIGVGSICHGGSMGVNAVMLGSCHSYGYLSGNCKLQGNVIVEEGCFVRSFSQLICVNTEFALVLRNGASVNDRTHVFGPVLLDGNFEIRGRGTLQFKSPVSIKWKYPEYLDVMIPNRTLSTLKDVKKVCECFHSK